MEINLNSHPLVTHHMRICTLNKKFKYHRFVLHTAPKLNGGVNWIINKKLWLQLAIFSFSHPQVSSLTSSPDSSPSPLLGQINTTSNHNQTPNVTVPGNNGATYSSTSTSNTNIQNTITDSKLWMANSTTASPHSLSPKTFSFDSTTNPSSTADSGSGSSEMLR